MNIPVTFSEQPLHFDVMQAVKVRYYWGDERCPPLYAYGRMYVHAGTLCASLTVFQKQPEEQNCIALAVSNGKKILFYTLSPFSGRLFLCPSGSQLPPDSSSTLLSASEPLRFAGDDEQGWYWGAQIEISPEMLAKAGLSLILGSDFKAAVFYYRTDTVFGGSSFEAGNLPPLSAALFSNYTIVSY